MLSSVLFTPLMLSSFKPRDKEYTLYDAKLKGLGLRVQPGGAQSWVVLLRVDGKSRRVTLGPLARLELNEARRLAMEHLSKDTKDLFPRFARTITFNELSQKFTQAKASMYARGTQRSLQGYLKRELLPAFGAKRMEQISSPDFATWFYGYSQISPGGADKAKGHFTTMFNWALKQGVLLEGMPNPAYAIKANKRRPRGQMLNADQVEALLDTLEQLPKVYLDAAEIIRLILFTGCRSGEILRLRWQEVKPDMLTLERTKTGPRVVMLSDAAQKVLIRLARRRVEGAEFVFPTKTDAGKPRRNIDASWSSIKARAGLDMSSVGAFSRANALPKPCIRLHDLRHTFASHAILSGETIAATGALLGHKPQRSTQIYTHLDQTALTQSAEKVAKEIETLFGIGL